MKKTRILWPLLTLAIALTMVSFQNCSPQNFGSKEEPSATAAPAPAPSSPGLKITCAPASKEKAYNVRNLGSTNPRCPTSNDTPAAMAAANVPQIVVTRDGDELVLTYQYMKGTPNPGEYVGEKIEVVKERSSVSEDYYDEQFFSFLPTTALGECRLQGALPAGRYHILVHYPIVKGVSYGCQVSSAMFDVTD